MNDKIENCPLALFAKNRKQNLYGRFPKSAKQDSKSKHFYRPASELKFLKSFQG